MLYLSIALITVAVIFSIKPPTIVFKKILVVDQPVIQYQQAPEDAVTPEELRKLTPPSMDDLVATVNDAIFGITEEDLND